MPDVEPAGTDLLNRSPRQGWPCSECGPSAVRPPQAGLWPRISIVTPSFNQGDFIEETIRSVLLQGYPNLQYIVIDGGSTDQSVEVIKKYRDRLDYWASEQDRGQSHAINKGLARCTGEIFNWINSDDVLMPGALWAVARAWMDNPGHIISGSTEFFDENGTFKVMPARAQSLRHFVRFWEGGELGWAQQSTFLPLCALRDIGGVDESLKFCMDYNMMVRLLREGTEVIYVDEVLARFRFHETSKTVGSTVDFRLERIPMLSGLKDLPVHVEEWEWQAQQSVRLVDVARRSYASGNVRAALRLLGKAFITCPTCAFKELTARSIARVRRAFREDPGGWR